MAKKQTAYRLTDTAIDYIDIIADKNNLSKTDALELIIREHQKQSSDELEKISEAVIDKFESKYKNFMTRLRLSTNYTDRNVQIALEVLNTMLIGLSLDKNAITTKNGKCQTLIQCENEIIRKIAEYKQYNDNKKSGD